MFAITASVAVLFSGIFNPVPALSMPAVTASQEVVENTTKAQVEIPPAPTAITGFNLQTATGASQTSFSNDGIEERLRKEFKDTPIMIRIAFCESTMRQFEKDGSVLRGKVERRDLGLFQVNDFFHGEKAEELGLDLHTLDGNIEYAKYLYEKKGTQPWKASRPCWGKDLATNQ